MSAKRALNRIAKDNLVSGSNTEEAGGILRIRIIKSPTKGDCDLLGFDASHFNVGQVYETGPRLAELLIVCGYAEPEMRRDQAADRPTRRKTTR